MTNASLGKFAVVCLLATAVPAGCPAASAETATYRLFAEDAMDFGALSEGRRLGLGDPARCFPANGAAVPLDLRLRFPHPLETSPPEARVLAAAVAPDPRPTPSPTLGALVSAGALAGSAYNSWRGGSFSHFHFTNEQFFGRDTYTGGVDKASHFVDYNITARAITAAYEMLGYSELRSQVYGSGTALLAGLVTEIGDGTTGFGFSYEDFVMDAFGAATALGLAATGWDDTIGFRLGRFQPAPTPACCDTVANYGRDYSGEIYSGDLKIDGAARRLHVRPGLARYLLLSMNYGTNGYRFATRDIRQRLIGIEVGANLAAVADSLGVPHQTWWGRVAYLLLESFRLPYTGIGFRYDLNHKKWYGPTAGRTPFDTTEAAGGM